MGKGVFAMKQPVKLLMIGSGLAALGAVALGSASVAITGKLVRIALDRDLPARMDPQGKNRDRIAGSAGDLGYMEELRQAGLRLQRERLERVTLLARDGERLVGHWRPCEKPGRVILAMHGWRSSWHRDFGIIADFWKDNGCSVLFAEQRGQGNSGGAYMGFGMTERYDCLDWVRWINSRTGGRLPVYLGGVSMGAATVLMAAGLDLPENVKGIVADCGFTSAREIWKHVARNNLHLAYGHRAALVDALCQKRIQLRSDACSAPEALRNTKIPVLFVHGTHDRFVPVEMTYENYQACAGPKRLFVVPGADHGESYLKDPSGYREAMTSFWEWAEKKL